MASKKGVLVVLAALGLGGLGIWGATRKAAAAPEHPVMPLATIGIGLIWYAPLGDWQVAATGRSIPMGADIYLAPFWVNESTGNLTGHIALSVAYPDGHKVSPAATLNQDKQAAPGNGWYVEFAAFNANQSGTYTLTAQLTVGGQAVDTVTFTLVAS